MATTRFSEEEDIYTLFGIPMPKSVIEIFGSSPATAIFVPKIVTSPFQVPGSVLSKVVASKVA